MIKDITIEAQPREGLGKGPAHRLRAKGLVPVAIYGEGKAASSVAVNGKELANILRSETGHNTIFKINLPGSDPATVIFKDWQIDPVKGRLMHADLMRISMNTATRVMVPIVAEGEPAGVKQDGGILEIQLREVEVECLPGDIPESIKVDVSGLGLGAHVTVADLKVDREKITLLAEDSQSVASVLAPRLSEEAASAAGEAAASEPEVIKKGKTEE